MQWDKLISDKRFGLETYHNHRGATRSDFVRDYDRLVFSSPFRRLQNKTQVFPLPGSIFVHNRLTHSLEVSCVGRSLAREVVDGLLTKYASESWRTKLLDIPDIVAAGCLAHDLGNPPFGHSGEKAISTFFSEGPGKALQAELTEEQWCDLINFEGNANSFRQLTHQFNGRRPGGFAMTYSMLAAIVKYPYESRAAVWANKFGFFCTERAGFERIATELEMLRLPSPESYVKYARHPLVYLVEAADDICYEVMDIEDAHKLKILSHDEVMKLLLGFYSPEQQAHKLEIMERIADPNEKVGYMRSCVVGTLVECCAETFLANEDAILNGTFSGTLLDRIRPAEREAYEACNRLSWAKIYCAPDVVDIELAGNRIITFLMDKLIHAVRFPELNYSRLLLSKVPEQYDVHSDDLFTKVQAAVDHVASMTDVYALDLYRRLNGQTLPAV
ncbi:MAG: dNTP triphosphohydrolase [Bacteroides sp.]|nr:dNTP triphosphohydrolase [Bacteroides sp.]MCM1379829.1 dNTP triphosphohydrolase [Bacteroides sp.]MCM1446188.1 dNTP triphosphohydrolase [Prevotella sp.]